jgi:thiol:disulfide interchange protein DsbD
MTAALSGALLLALGLWLWNDRRLRQALALACLVGAVALGSMRGLDGVAALSKGHVVWSEEAVAAQRNAGNPVFVDVTADWCITCLANETAVLLTEDMIKAFVDHGVVYMVADWTKQDANIAALLQQHGRNGIPLYLMYPADIGAAPLILPQLLTKKIVREALQSVSGKNGDFIARF